MPSEPPHSPYDLDFTEECPLADAPLVRVLAQVRHPALRVLSGEQGNDIALRIARRVAEEYPVFDRQHESTYVVTPEGVREERDTTAFIWRLRDASEAWQLSFGKEFVALETASYAGRRDFCDRLARALRAYAEEVAPPSASRIGIRYTNRLDQAAHLKDIARLIRTELLGPVSLELPPSVALGHSFSQAQFLAPDGGSILNWGYLPANGLFDPTMKPTATASWLLDIDAFHSTKVDFDAEHLDSLTRTLAARAYTHFRWAVTDEFLETFKGSG